MNYVEHEPGPGLAPWVRCLWELRDTSPLPGRPAVERILPDGCFEIVFHLETPFARLLSDGELRPQSAALLVGATTTAVELARRGHTEAFGIRFEPGGAGILGGPPAWRWTDVIEPLEALGDRELDELGERLSERAFGVARADLVRVLLDRRAAATRRPPVLARAARALASGRRSVDDVARAAGSSTRQLERLFRDQVGFGPKLLARLGRFQRAARLVSRTRRPLVEVALDCGYSDQAHLTREFNGFAGTPPARFRRESHTLAATFLTEES